MQPRSEGERLGCLQALCTAFRCTRSPARGCSSPHLSCETPDCSPQAFVLFSRGSACLLHSGTDNLHQGSTRMLSFAH